MSILSFYSHQDVIKDGYRSCIYDCYRIFPYFVELMFSLYLPLLFLCGWRYLKFSLFYANLFVYSTSIVFLVYDI
jgi:hypothetical protein